MSTVSGSPSAAARPSANKPGGGGLSLGRRAARWFGDRTLRTKLLSAGLAGVAGLTVLLGMTWAGNSELDATSDRLAASASRAKASANLQYLSSVARSRQLDYVLDIKTLGVSAARPQAEKRASFLQGIAALDKALADYPTTSISDEQKARLAELKQLHASFVAEDTAAVALYAKGAPSLPEADKRMNGTRPIQAKFLSIGDAMIKRADAQVERFTQELHDGLAAGWTRTVIVFVIVSAVVVALALFAAKRVLHSVSRLRRSIEAMGRGDLTVPAEVDSRDEIGAMAQATEETREAMRGLIGQVRQASTSVADSSAHLTSVSQGIERGAASTATELERTTVAASEVSTNVQTVAAGTEEMTSSIREIAKSANDAAGVAAQAVSVADNANSTVGKLGESSVEIGNVIKVITSIAEQTNLLALNATIEAARAGEAGKGFAVVANEVKDLAQETGKATEDISRRIEQIQMDTEAAVTAISQISGIIAQINDTQSTIASAVEEQTATTNEMGRNVAEAATGSENISHNVTAAARGATESTSAAKGLTTAAGELAQRAAELQTLVSNFSV